MPEREPPSDQGRDGSIEPGSVHASEAVRRAADEAIRAEAIRQLDSIELDDEDVDGRIEPLEESVPQPLDLPRWSTQRDSDRAEGSTVWDEVSGRFLPADEVYFHRS